MKQSQKCDQSLDFQTYFKIFHKKRYHLEIIAILSRVPLFLGTQMYLDKVTYL